VLINRFVWSASSRRIGTSVNRVIVRCAPTWSEYSSSTVIGSC